MADLLEDGVEAWSVTGTPDTVTVRTDGPNGSDIVAANVNGPALGVKAIQTALGSALTLKGSAATLAARLAIAVAPDGALPKGTVYPSNPVDGQAFYRTDENQLYIYDAGVPQWKTLFQGGGITSLDHGTLGGLNDDDHPLYALLTMGRDFTGDVKIKKDTPAIRLKGTEAQSKDIRLVETAGEVKLQENIGSEGTPTWFDLLNLRNSFFSVPSAMGSGSSLSHDGNTTVTTNTTMGGIRFYTNFTLNAGIQIDIGSPSGQLAIIASESIVINGTINGGGRGATSGGAGATVASQVGGNGFNGNSQGGGGGGAGTTTSGGLGGDVFINGVLYSGGGIGSNQLLMCLTPWMDLGGGSGGGGGVDNNGPTAGGNGGNGGASIILIAPNITLGVDSLLNTVGGNGSAGNSSPGSGGGGGGGGAGNIYMICRIYTDNGCAFTQSGGTGGSPGGSAGSNGVKQILLYP
jgi:hypothetical protein